MPADAVILLFIIILLPLLAAAVFLRWIWVKIARRAGAFPSDAVSITERRKVILPAGLILVVYVLCFLWSLLIEPDWIQVTRTEISTDRPVLGYNRFRIVHLSDLHLEGDRKRVRMMVDAVEGERPHLILMTGDYLNTSESAGLLVEALSSIDAPFGIYGVTGNWDHKFDIPKMFREAAAARGTESPMLIDESHKLITRGGRKLLLLGLGIFPHRSLAEMLEGASPESYRIFLAHMPDAVEEINALAGDERVDLFLCGHTHGGQVRLPFWGAVMTFSKFHKKYEAGHYRMGKTHMYVSRGIGMMGGFAPRIRFLCRPEVAVIDLVHRP